MCTYISATHVMPGYLCCQCKTYNGLQRVKIISKPVKVTTLCKFSRDGKHKLPGCELLNIPGEIVQCANCFAGYDANADGTPQMPTMDGTGKRFNPLFCYVCGKEFKKRTPETDKEFIGKAIR